MVCNMLCCLDKSCLIGGNIIFEAIPVISFFMGILVSSLSEVTVTTTGISILLLLIGVIGYIRILTSESQPTN